MRRFILFFAIAAAAAPGCKSGGEKTDESGGGEAMATSPYGKPGFTAVPAADNRIWVFRTGSKELAEFQQKGELVKFVTRPGAGPGGMTVRSADAETIVAYAAARDGFVTFVRENRIWVFRPGTKDLAEFEKSGEPAKCITRPLAGPMRMTVKGPDVDTVTEYLCAKEGFVTRCEDSRLWVFRAGSKELAEFEKQGELAKHVTKIGAGPGGVTVKAPDSETIAAYVVANDGFATFVRDGRIWVFRKGSRDLAEFRKTGEPAKCITRPLAGPMRMTVKGPDTETVDAYLAVMVRPAPAPAVTNPKPAVTMEKADTPKPSEVPVAEVTMYEKAGFVAALDDDGRLWVFREDAKEIAEFRRQGELTKHVTRIGAGPGGITVKGPDTATILEYVAASDGFVTYIRDERIWVFRPDSKDLEEFLKSGEPAKCYTRIGAGPLRMTVKGADVETIDAYLAAVSP
ncbi:MAG TPA: hypothetical protein VFY93_18985 [Planctomycetota bacterium]|nr:hypothetical protein [Planctomycetota bacterium]